MQKKKHKKRSEFHSHRTPGCDRYHSDPGINTAAGAEQSP